MGDNTREQAINFAFELRYIKNAPTEPVILMLGVPGKNHGEERVVVC